MMIELMFRIGLNKGCNLKKVWELVGLMTLWLMIIDEWLGFEGVINVVAVLLGCFSSFAYDICVSSGEPLFERSVVKGGYVGVTWEI